MLGVPVSPCTGSILVHNLASKWCGVFLQRPVTTVDEPAPEMATVEPHQAKSARLARRFRPSFFFPFHLKGPHPDFYLSKQQKTCAFIRFNFIPINPIFFFIYILVLFSDRLVVTSGSVGVAAVTLPLLYTGTSFRCRPRPTCQRRKQLTKYREVPSFTTTTNAKHDKLWAHDHTRLFKPPCRLADNPSIALDCHSLKRCGIQLPLVG